MSVRFVGCEMSQDQFMNSPGAEVVFAVEVGGREIDDRVLVIDMDSSPHSERFQLFEDFTAVDFIHNR